MQSFNLIKQIPLILKPSFWTCIFFISNVIVSTKIYDKGYVFGFEIVKFSFIDGDVPCSNPMEFIFLNSSALLVHLAMLLTSTLAVNC